MANDKLWKVIVLTCLEGFVAILYCMITWLLIRIFTKILGYVTILQVETYQLLSLLLLLYASVTCVFLDVAVSYKEFIEELRESD